MSERIFISSDYHFNHDKEFIWKSRGFSSIQEMNENIIEKHNLLVRPDDTIYILGDIMLGDNKEGIEYLRRMNGHKIIIIGNHDTSNRVELYKRELDIPVFNVFNLKYHGYNFYLSHFPTITSEREIKKLLKNKLINICGHRHTVNKFFDMDIGIIYHAEVDSHCMLPVRIDKIISDIKAYLNIYDPLV